MYNNTMEFKFRDVDDRPPMYSSPSSSAGYFYERELRASYPSVFMRQIPEPTRNELIQRQIEKERIREEIIAQEIAWRRELEAEVRRELMVEREMAMRERGLISFEEKMTMRFDSRQFMPPGPFVNQFECSWLKDRLAFHDRGMFNMWPPVRPMLPEPEIKPSTENNKDKLIVLKKPDPNLCGAKRKAAMLTPCEGAGELPFAGTKEKLKEDWSCALCQVSATSVRGLNEHLQGRRHKAKEAGLRAQKMAKNPNNASLPKKTAKAAKVTILTAGLKQGAKIEGELLDKKDDISNKKTENKEERRSKSDEQLVQKNQQSEIKNKNVAEKVQIWERAPKIKTKKEFNFWCEMCQVGSYSAAVMDDHKKGKKHLARLRESSKNSEAVVSDDKAKDSEFVVMDDHKKGKKHVAWLRASSQNSEAVQSEEKAKDSEFVTGAEDPEIVAEETKDSELPTEGAKDSEFAAEGANTKITVIVIADEMADTIVANAD